MEERPSFPVTAFTALNPKPSHQIALVPTRRRFCKLQVSIARRLLISLDSKPLPSESEAKDFGGQVSVC